MPAAHVDVENLFKQILDNISDIVVITTAGDANGSSQKIVYANEAFTHHSGYPLNEVIGKSPNLLQGPSRDPAAKAKIHAALAARKPVRAQLLNYAKDGHPFWVDLSIVPLRGRSGEVVYFAAIERDITEQKRLEERLGRLASTDELTGLDNRRKFMTTAEGEMARSTRYGRPLSLIVADLDRFKRINDAYGHDAGDQAIVAFANICRDQLRPMDHAARIGGDEFAILVTETEIDGAARAAERIREALSRLPIWRDGREFRMTASFGVTQHLGADDGLRTFLKRADIALYEAKTGGRDRVCLCDGAANELCSALP